MELFFTFEGRVSKLMYWIISLIMGGLFFWYERSDSMVALILLLVLLWPSLAISVKRWHDRNKSGRWVFISFVPIVGSIWTLIELGFLKGTEGPNDYGDDPLVS